MSILFNVRSIYFVWFLFQTVLFIISGWIKNFASAFLKMEWDKVVFYNDKFYPFNGSVITDYDLSEYLIYLIIPLILFRIIAKLFGN